MRWDGELQREKWKVGAFECEWHRHRESGGRACAAPACAPHPARSPPAVHWFAEARRSARLGRPRHLTLFNSRLVNFSDDSYYRFPYLLHPAHATPSPSTLILIIITGIYWKIVFLRLSSFPAWSWEVAQNWEVPKFGNLPAALFFSSCRRTGWIKQKIDII